MNGVNGYVVRGKGDYVSNSIFLPCAGNSYGSSLDLAGLEGDFWSSVPDSDNDYAWGLGVYSRGLGMGRYSRYYGLSVRPLQGFTK